MVPRLANSRCVFSRNYTLLFSRKRSNTVALSPKEAWPKGPRVLPPAGLPISFRIPSR